jgi:hypothetical protein
MNKPLNKKLLTWGKAALMTQGDVKSGRFVPDWWTATTGNRAKN